MLFRLDERLVFPPADLAEPGHGILAVGGDLRPERLLLAYAQGIFPWYSEDEPIHWHSPDPRFVLPLESLRVPRSLRKTTAKRPYRLSLDCAFREVISACSRAPRPDQDGTWITGEMAEAYSELHRLGYAHSVESWRDGELVGGLYGVSLGSIFFGESMFARAADASKIAFVTLVAQLRRWGLRLVDSQVETEHMARFGCVHWPRRRYLAYLARALRQETRRGRWSLDEDLGSGGLPDSRPGHQVGVL